jgi:ribosomal protein S19
MSRSKWKGPFIEKTLLKSFLANMSPSKNNKSRVIETQSRCSTILPIFCGKSIKVHNGKQYILLKITKEMAGYKFGEFVPTRRRFFFKKTNKH